LCPAAFPKPFELVKKPPRTRPGETSRIDRKGRKIRQPRRGCADRFMGPGPGILYSCAAAAANSTVPCRRPSSSVQWAPP
jgi:hypothetical protein